MTNLEVKPSTSKYGQGYHMGDYLTLESHYKIENDTIYKDMKAIAIKVSTIKRFNNSQVLIIKALDKYETGTYHAK